MQPQWADDDTIRRWVNALIVLGEQHGLRNLALGERTAQIIADVDKGRTYFDIVDFEFQAESILGSKISVTPSGVAGAKVRAPLTGSSAA
ncbi:MAG: hypothetical protein J2O49_04395 [Sciscionella sp.]|nr:hypothetical protein [Sciscionella sp.]